MPVTTSNSTNYYSNRDAIITRALRIVNALGQGEVPTTAQVTEAAEPLNDIIKELIVTGNPLWANIGLTLPLTAGTYSYMTYVGASSPNLNASPILKLSVAFLRHTTTYEQVPLTIITGHQYNNLANKTSPGQPSQIYHSAVTNNSYGGSGGEMATGTYLWPAPDATTAANYQLILSGQGAFQDLDAAADLPDFPSYWTNAIKWALADQLAYEYGLPLAERSMISKKANEHLTRALSYGTEEGSLFLQPDTSGR